jgi:hypothetical protein
LRPFTGFPESKPCGLTFWVVFTRTLSMTPAKGPDPPFQDVRRHHLQMVDRRRNIAVLPVVKFALHHREW